LLKVRITQIFITSIALTILAIHLIWPDLKIDATTLILLIIAVVPWLAQTFKSLEFPGGWKIEFQELENAR